MVASVPARTSTLGLALVALAVVAGPAHAEAPWIAPTVITVPTAWTQPGTAVYASLGGDHRFGTSARATVGYARLVEVDVGGDGLLTSCAPCDGPAREVEPAQLATAGWKLAVRPTARLALAGGLRVPLPGGDGRRAAQGFAIGSLRLGPVALHAGASTWASRHRGDDGAEIALAPPTSVRPLVGLEWTPRIYPRTTLGADLQWLPELGPTAATTAARWSFAWGVRYRALPYSAIELAVRHREGDALGDATVMVRLSAVLSARPR